MSEQNLGKSKSDTKNRGANSRPYKSNSTSAGRSSGGYKSNRSGGFKKSNSSDGRKSGYSRGKSTDRDKKPYSKSDGDARSRGGSKPYDRSDKRFDSKKTGRDGEKRFGNKRYSDNKRRDGEEGFEKKPFDKKRSNGQRGGENKGGFKKKSFDKERKYGDKPFKKERSFDKRPARDVAPESGENINSETTAQGAKKGWTPNMDRKVRSKKAFDQMKTKALVEDKGGVYKGELDPLRGERSQIAMGRINREAKRAAEDAERERERLEREERRAHEDEEKPLQDKFEPSNASMARLAALDVTRTVRRRNAYAQELIESRIDNSDMTKADRAFATLLVLGVVSTYGMLDEVINRGLKRPDDISFDVRDALRISTYEIIMLGKSPHAAVDQGVELIKAIVPSASGLGNAVLHRILKMKEEFPFGDPATDLAALARLYAFPKWMARMLIEDIGAKPAADLMRVSNDPAPLFIHVNALNATDEEVASVFEDAGAALTPATAAEMTPPGCYHVNNPRVLANKAIHALFEEGKILASDASAQVIAQALLPETKPARFLEIGAGRGTKTIMLQSFAKRKYGSQMALTSLDSHEFKTQLLAERCALYGVELENIVAGNATRMDHVLPGQQFDVVFIDAPCSGLGTLRRHQEIRWRINDTHIAELAETQLAMLRSACGNVAEGGSLVYATCTVTYAENNGVVKRFLESPEGANFKLAPIEGKPCIATQITSGSPDAHFCARFVKVS